MGEGVVAVGSRWGWKRALGLGLDQGGDIGVGILGVGVRG